MTDPRPIGVFDSGVGGLTVLREILRRTPDESTIYFGDNARAPYGTRTDDEVRAFSTESIDALVERDVKAVVVACNTSTAVALGDLRRRYDLPILGVIRPGRRHGRARRRATAASASSDAGDDPLARLLRGDQGREPGRRGLRARHADVRADGRGRPADRPGGRGRRARGARAAPRRARRARRVHLPAAGLGPDRHAAPRLHPLPAAARRIAAVAGERIAIVDFGGRHRVRPRGAAVDQRARGARGATARPGTAPEPARMSSSRPATSTRFRSIASGCSATRFRTSPASSRAAARAAASRRTRNEPAHPPRPSRRRRRAAGATIDAGRPASSSARRSAPPRRSSAGAPSGSRAAGLVDWARGRAARDPAGAETARRARSRRWSCEPPRAPIARRWPRVVPRLARGPRDASCPASSTGPASSIGRAGSGRTSARSGRSSRGSRTELLDQVVPGGRRPHAGDDGPRQSLGDEPAARLPARVHGHPRARPVRPRAAVRRGRGRPAALRRGEHPRHRARARRSASRRSGPGSRCTRRPTPSSSRRIPGSGRTSPSAWSASSACSAATRSTLGRDALRGHRPGAARRGRWRALDGATHGRRAARASSARRRR